MPGDWGPILQSQGGAPTYYLYDMLHNTRIATTLAATQTIVYTAFGSQVFDSFSGGTPLRKFQGEMGYDMDLSNLNYARNRYVDPAKARWISRDPIGYDGGDWNLYRYAGNNPINFTDPEGLMPFYPPNPPPVSAPLPAPVSSPRPGPVSSPRPVSVRPPVSYPIKLPPGAANAGCSCAEQATKQTAWRSVTVVIGGVFEIISIPVDVIAGVLLCQSPAGGADDTMDGRNKRWRQCGDYCDENKEAIRDWYIREVLKVCRKLKVSMPVAVIDRVLNDCRDNCTTEC